jgi:hypothetical protein
MPELKKEPKVKTRSKTTRKKAVRKRAVRAAPTDAELLAKVLLKMEGERGYQLTAAKNAMYREYDRDIQPELVRVLGATFGLNEEVGKRVGSELQVYQSKIGQGSYGKVYKFSSPKWPFDVAVKVQSCDSQFRKEEMYLRSMQRLDALGVISLGKIFDSYAISGKKQSSSKRGSKKQCITVMPMASSDLAHMDIYAFQQDYMSIIMQSLVGVLHFHTYLQSLHCDAHTSNWFIYDSPFRSTRIEGYLVPSAKVTVGLMDPGIARNVPLRGTDVCRNPVYDYYRLLSPFSGLCNYFIRHGWRRGGAAFRLVLRLLDALTRNYKIFSGDERFELGNAGTESSPPTSFMQRLGHWREKADYRLRFMGPAKSHEIFALLMNICTQFAREEGLDRHGSLTRRP